ncbi:methylmalonyl Co-A mutase-associated GTPase MeaB [Rhodococcus antarcticus]|uniref:Methylmalonyl Co-A mutase-associated GTPase MeaB n=1 Tax=Rhodococcus antarcticus TaxID=2987751 RepID=A0ABY6P1U6_9NOCA|nr:methylmalonyl Co-A mutase-associated GTPase MeaB [Rhodococcus antarcticus]UZJ25622.1 methylmalonyl Co-A mutase-associated GTPase MeaB [Rhodococcus antarcticus]
MASGFRGRQADVADLVARARDGQARAVARLISLVEDASPQLREVAASLAPHTGHAQVIGLTGSPGVGKSTSTSALVQAYRAAGQRVGVLAIDPSSPFSGGALLGDRVRMQEHATDSGVFIRSMATRGHLGGLSWATPQALRVLDAAGFDIVLVETVGVGQSEVEVVSLADSTLVLLAPGMGDGIQAAKAGILEVADVFVVNKADRDGADTTVRELKHMISLGRREQLGPSWRVPVVKTVASRGEGVGDVVAAIAAHREWTTAHGELERRRIVRASAEIEAIALQTLRDRMGSFTGSTALEALASDVVDGTTDPYVAADELVGQLTT